MEIEPKMARNWILIVEDNPLDMKLFSALLLAEGYEVLEAANGDDAQQLIGRRNGKKIDLLLRGGHYLQVQPNTDKVYYPFRNDNRVVVIDLAHVTSLEVANTRAA